MGKKLTIEHIKDEFEKEGYTLLSEEYKRAHVKLNFICDNNHKHSISWASWQQGHRCKLCAIKLFINNRKNSLIDVIKSFESDGYNLLSDEYNNAYTKLDYECSNGHRHNITYTNWITGNRCPTCSGRAKPTIEYVIESFSNEGYELLSKEYKNAHVKLKYICSKGHGHSITWMDWRRNHRCPTCANINFSLNQMGNKNHQWQGGLSYEPYCEVWKDKEYKEDIKVRDGNKCLNPYCYSKKPNNLTIHHIDYNKKNCRPGNLITICRSCNGMANKDREWHRIWYQAIIKNRYGGVKCP
jgi:DNA-directed RNA polymerase subunit RPC12/RpoP